MPLFQDPYFFFLLNGSQVAGSQLPEFPEWNLKLPPHSTAYIEGKERPKKEADQSRLVSGQFKKQGNIHARLILYHQKVSGSLHPPTRILEVYIETLTGLSHVYCPDGFNNTCSLKAASLKIALTVGMVCRTSIPRTEEGMRSPWLSGSSPWVNWQSCPLDGLL